jgi:hypothetical protein
MIFLFQFSKEKIAKLEPNNSPFIKDILSEKNESLFLPVMSSVQLLASL